MSGRSGSKFYFFKSKVVVVGHFIYSLYSTACSQGSSVVSDLGRGLGGRHSSPPNKANMFVLESRMLSTDIDNCKPVCQ